MPVPGLAGLKTWRVAQPPDELVSALSSELGVSRLTAFALVNRGLETPAEAAAFLAGDTPGGPEDRDPFALPHMDKAVTRLLTAIQSRERVVVYGDYDVDGVAATAVLVTALRAAGADVSWYIPDRFSEGYGLHGPALERIREEGAGLVVTVDCGVTAFGEAAFARSLGLDLIISDHHEPGRSLPPAAAVVHPHLAAEASPLRVLSGVGVAFKLAQALARFEGKPGAEKACDAFLDLAALGTVADVVPLLGENRTLVKGGLRVFNAGDNAPKDAPLESGGPAAGPANGPADGPAIRPPAAPRLRTGLRALRRVASLEGREVTSYHLTFQFAPRLNAAGRLGAAERALRLLLTDDDAEAAALAAELDRSNRERQAIEEEILTQAASRAEKEIDLDAERAIVLAGEGWNEGVIGIVASRLVERFARPALLVAVNSGVGRGSGRSIAAFDLVAALGDCAAWLGRFGGHRMAAGFEIAQEDIASFSQDFLELARRRLTRDDLIHELRIDAWADPEELSPPGRDSPGLLGELERLEPFGTGNPEPVFALAAVRFLKTQGVGEGGRHLKASVAAGRRVLDCIGFGLGELAPQLNGNPGLFDVAFRPAADEWQGRVRLQLKLLDIRPASSAWAGPGPRPGTPRRVTQEGPAV